jgi:16S rRNA (uracil1498-N3)-methyltransferase
MRLFVEGPLAAADAALLPEGAARHAMVRRVQPGDLLWLFDGRGSDWPAEVLAVGRRAVQVRIGTPVAVATEAATAVTLALGMPANERMDALVEKATELGVAAIQPLVCERSVLVLHGERAERKRAHWQAVAQAACEQCGRAIVPRLDPVCSLADWLASEAARDAAVLRSVLSLRADARAWRALCDAALPGQPRLLLSGPEGGLAPAEEDQARAQGFVPATLGPRVLRADTAPLAALAYTALSR